jgi:hypothetical protein
LSTRTTHPTPRCFFSQPLSSSPSSSFPFDFLVAFPDFLAGLVTTFGFAVGIIVEPIVFPWGENISSPNVGCLLTTANIQSKLVKDLMGKFNPAIDE